MPEQEQAGSEEHVMEYGVDSFQVINRCDICADIYGPEYFEAAALTMTDAATQTDLSGPENVEPVKMVDVETQTPPPRSGKQNDIPVADLLLIVNQAMKTRNPGEEFLKLIMEYICDYHKKNQTDS